MRKYSMGSLSDLPLADRNRLAGMWALLKAYNRRINTGHVQSSAVGGSVAQA
jgi:hypothetical protein